MLQLLAKVLLFIPILLVKALPAFLFIALALWLTDGWNRRIDLFGTLGPIMRTVGLDYEGVEVPTALDLFTGEAFASSRTCGTCDGVGMAHKAYPGGITSFETCGSCGGRGKR